VEVPIYIAELDENNPNAGLKFTSLVRMPAIRMKYLAFAEQAAEMKFAFNDEQQIIAGPSMVADMPLLQIDRATGQKYYIVFPPSTISQSVKFMASKNLFNSVDMQHNEIKMSGVNLYEMFIVNRARGINPPKGFESLTDGSLWQGYHIPDKKQFDHLKLNFSGFSIQGFYDLKPSEDVEEMDIKNILEELLNTTQRI